MPLPLGTKHDLTLEGRIGSRLLTTVSKVLGPFRHWFYYLWVLWDLAFADLQRFLPYLSWEQLKFNRVSSIWVYYWTLEGDCWWTANKIVLKVLICLILLTCRASFLLNKSNTFFLRIETNKSSVSLIHFKSPHHKKKRFVVLYCDKC